MNSPGVRRQGMFGRTPSFACIQDYIAIALMDEQVPANTGPNVQAHLGPAGERGLEK
jgi:hypothetical protein